MGQGGLPFIASVRLSRVLPLLLLLVAAATAAATVASAAVGFSRSKYSVFRTNVAAAVTAMHEPASQMAASKRCGICAREPEQRCEASGDPNGISKTQNPTDCSLAHWSDKRSSAPGLVQRRAAKLSNLGRPQATRKNGRQHGYRARAGAPSFRSLRLRLLDGLQTRLDNSESVDRQNWARPD
ncbi:hypothetical protein B0T26DRAFT_315130 [Lasiosphaeria miniovina]|uniref:Uncharacterized protein n=1 Tax=Lasiosphaeria miniovina TaxID=1954250 RepID=A0AA40ALN9_9PEZI|nr:uncharacterized protein B0T26DRAFT_315130 [Lasiosphaeria miniovina]KAK0718142.1 hypothetical protein B0T26DRAFT_315130 [Lasiosphaeria miniovina]